VVSVFNLGSATGTVSQPVVRVLPAAAARPPAAAAVAPPARV